MVGGLALGTLDSEAARSLLVGRCAVDPVAGEAVCSWAAWLGVRSVIPTIDDMSSDGGT